jgi:arachidonate 15-lipoxygenase
VWLYSAFSPMQPELPPIAADPQSALANAYTWLHRRRFPPPTMPAEFLGSPDLGSLAVRGPYAAYTKSAGEGAFEWDTGMLSRYEHHPGLHRLGARVRFELDRRNRALRATRISSVLGETVPGEARWEVAKKLALCSMTTHLSLVRHFNWVHLASGAMLAVATRNRLPPAHPLLRLLWPYIYDTQQSNDVVTRGQMVRGGDFECCFSLNHEGLCRLFDDTWDEFDLVMNDPSEDARRRGVLDQGFDTPTEDNLASLFDTMHAHARSYLRLYWSDDAALRADDATLGWLDELNERVPNGVGVTRDSASIETLARMIARFLYLVTAQHELLGSFLWNYQLWTHRQPVRMYASGDREPLDVYQRLVNANYNLNVRRRALIHDFSYLALDKEGAAEMKRFHSNLEALQTRMEREPWTVWKLYPAVLKVNINA